LDTARKFSSIALHSALPAAARPSRLNVVSCATGVVAVNAPRSRQNDCVASSPNAANALASKVTAIEQKKKKSCSIGEKGKKKKSRWNFFSFR
jgi:hypothetical protein